MSVIPEGYEYGDLRAIRLTVRFENGKANWTAMVQNEGDQVIDRWCGTGGWSSPMEALERELGFAKQRALRQQDGMV